MTTAAGAASTAIVGTETTCSCEVVGLIKLVDLVCCCCCCSTVITVVAGVGVAVGVGVADGAETAAATGMLTAGLVSCSVFLIVSVVGGGGVDLFTVFTVFTVFN